MNWCGRCFTGKIESDFDSDDDDGEYEYFVDSNYICKRKKNTKAINGVGEHPANKEAISTEVSTTAKSQSESSCSTSLGRNSTGGSRLEIMTTCRSDYASLSPSSDTGKKSSIDSTVLKGARVWKVGHSTVCGPASPLHQSHRPLSVPSGSNCEGKSKFLSKPLSQQLKAPSQIVPWSDHQNVTCKSESNTTSTTTSVTPNCSSGFTMKTKKRSGFMRRLFGRSRKSNKTLSRPSSFKEVMQQPSPAMATNTLYWTVRVKLK